MKKQTFQTLIITTIITLSLIMTTYPNLTIKAQTNTQLTVTGLVDRPLNLTLNELAAMPASTVNAAIICVDSPNQVLEQGYWVGVKLSTLLQTAGISTDAVKIGFFASDGYSTDLTVQTTMYNNVILAYQKDNQALSGLRLVVPGNWGYKWINQVTSIVVFNYDYLGHWESQGYSDDGTISFGAQKPPSGSIPSPKASPSPSPSASPAPSATPSPSQSPDTVPGALAQITTTQTPSNTFSPTEMFATVIGISAIVIVILTATVRKRRTNKLQN
jgi:DMSO/TMAO reductase YedYZ molybdopterin-dependent catalytic subunit